MSAPLDLEVVLSLDGPTGKNGRVPVAMIRLIASDLGVKESHAMQELLMHGIKLVSHSKGCSKKWRETTLKSLTDKGYILKLKWYEICPDNVRQSKRLKRTLKGKS